MKNQTDIVRLKPPATVKAIGAKELANNKDSCVFDEQKEIWIVTDDTKHYIVTIYPAKLLM